MAELRVLIVDDSAFMRLLVSDILSADKDLTVVGTAINGLEAVEKTLELKPDVVLLDLNMDLYDGLYAVRRIMKEHPVPILVLSAVGNTNLEPIFEALKLGAVDYMNKPSRNNAKMRDMETELILKVKSVIRARPKSLADKSKPARKAIKKQKRNRYELVVIGASTGGPSAIETVVSGLPEDFPVPVVICQHMPANFIAPFVNRLNTLSANRIEIGVKSMRLKPGQIVVAPGNANMIVTLDPTTSVPYVDFTDQKFPDYNHPSITAMMLSAAQAYGDKAIGVILTGMGKDGVEGLKAIKKKGGLTITQDKDSCVIYGMPKVAVESGASMTELDIKEIADYLVQNI
jgi:two-component system, chemotaxis family, protein-glutamate methylesterase/glutaminase